MLKLYLKKYKIIKIKNLDKICSNLNSSALISVGNECTNIAYNCQLKQSVVCLEQGTVVDINTGKCVSLLNVSACISDSKITLLNNKKI